MNNSKEKLDLSIKKITGSIQDESEKHPLHEYFIVPNHPNRCLFSGASGSGKTTLVINFITNRKFYRNFYDRIVIFSPSFHNDPQYDQIVEAVDDKLTIVDNLDKGDGLDQLQEIMDEMKEDVKQNGSESMKSLLVFDDMITDKNIKLVTPLFMRGRHMNSSVWIVSQSYMKCPRDIRLQLSNIFIFGAPQDSEVKRITDEIKPAIISDKLFKEIILDATLKRNFLHINMQCPERSQALRKNLDDVYNFLF